MVGVRRDSNAGRGLSERGVVGVGVCWRSSRSILWRLRTRLVRPPSWSGVHAPRGWAGAASAAPAAVTSSSSAAVPTSTTPAPTTAAKATATTPAAGSGAKFLLSCTFHFYYLFLCRLSPVTRPWIVSRFFPMLKEKSKQLVSLIFFQKHAPISLVLYKRRQICFF